MASVSSAEDLLSQCLKYSFTASVCASGFLASMARMELRSLADLPCMA